MSTLISLVSMLALVGMVLVYPMYFLDLSAFGKIMVREHPDIVGHQRLSLGDSYKLLQQIKAGRLGEVPLSAEALAAYARAKQLLYIGISLFLAFLLIVLTDAVLGRA